MTRPPSPAPGVTTLILWRHGVTDWNIARRIQGHSDTPLNAQGRAQAAGVAPLLAAREPVAIVSSDLNRCRQTAAPLAELTGLPVRWDRRLRERYYGEWEGLTGAEIAERWPESYARWRAAHDTADLGHGVERPADVTKRVGEALREIADAAPGATTVVVTHGGAARYGTLDLLDWPLDQVHSLAGLVNCHFTELRLDARRGWVLQAHNVGTVAGAPTYE
ncbi:MAG TPA: histidine phosphatase family protein [Natronosporangium sp.]|nr:histidine phosphatase family protein [Natronosporangium sp.]